MSLESDQNTICKDVLLTMPIVMYTQKDFPLVDSLNEKLGLVKTSGLVDYWTSYDIAKSLFKTDASVHPNVLTVGHFIGSF